MSSSSRAPCLDFSVPVELAVFLACPQIWEEEAISEARLTPQDRVSDLRRHTKPVRIERKFRYRANPDVFRRILNFDSHQDAVQIPLSEKFSGTYAPQRVFLFQNLTRGLNTFDIYESQHGTWVDEDSEAQHLYENFEVSVATRCGGMQTRSVLHGGVVGQWCGAGLPRARRSRMWVTVL